MVAADIPPGNADLAYNPVVAPVERKIIEHDVFRGDPEGSLDASETAHNIIANEIDLGVALGLGIGKRARGQSTLAPLPDQREIDGFGQRPGWRGTRIEDVEVSWSALRLMDVGETRQPCFLVERHRIITRLDDK